MSKTNCPFDVNPLTKIYFTNCVENCDINQFTTQIVHLSGIEICGHKKI